jgi:adenylate cyclase
MDNLSLEGMPNSLSMTILFADVSGSTKLFELRGDVEARRIVAAVLAALGEVATRYEGRVIKTIGDSVMCTFPSATAGIQAAVHMQKRIAYDLAFNKDHLAIRVGLHQGDALLEDNDVYGDAVNIAARMEQLAKREQIITTLTTIKEIQDPALQFRSLGTARVNGKQLPLEIVDVLWQENASNVTMVQRAIRFDSSPHISRAKFILRHRGRVFELSATSEPFTLGREANSSLIIDAEWVSRNHALIEYKRGHFVLADRSTNGTWIKLGENDELRLHRDETQLRKSGTISLGQSVSLNSEDVLYYQCSP